jgi:hypothetical protein
MAPAKTIYVKDADVPLWERFEHAVNDWGAADSVSALIADAMRKYLAQFGDQGDGLYVQTPDDEPEVFGDGVSAIMSPHGRGWVLDLDETVFGEDAHTPYELSFREIEDATTEARKHMAKARSESELMKAARRLHEARSHEDMEATASGRAAGREWALGQATPGELDEITKLASQHWLSFGWTFDDDGEDPWPTLYDALMQLPYGAEADERWQIERDPFMDGFVDSAADTYREIRSAEWILED